MTTVITRYFDKASRAREAKHELRHRWGLSPKIMHLYDTADGMAERLKAAHVDPETAQAYEKRVRKGGAVLLVEAGYQPLGVARMTREVTESLGGTEIEGLTEETWVKLENPPKPLLSVLGNHPLILTRPRDPDSETYHMADWPIPLVKRRMYYDLSILKDHPHFADFAFPLLDARKPYTGSVIARHGFMANWPFGHIVPGHRHFAKFPFGLLVPGNGYMAKFPFGHLVPGHRFFAKFPFGHLVPGQRHMANWPFPLLINGKRHTNALVPGHKYMAKWPFGHIVPGHKHYASAPIGLRLSHDTRFGRFPFGLLVPGQKFMAKFPFGHLVPGHRHFAKFPFGLLVPGHKYMANWIWPHTREGAA